MLTGSLVCYSKQSQIPTSFECTLAFSRITGRSVPDTSYHGAMTHQRGRETWHWHVHALYLHTRSREIVRESRLYRIAIHICLVSRKRSISRRSITRRSRAKNKLRIHTSVQEKYEIISHIMFGWLVGFGRGTFCTNPSNTSYSIAPF